MFDVIKKAIFRITVSDPFGKSCRGTAFNIARLRSTGSLIVATAKHVVDVPPNQTATWLFEQFDVQDGRILRELRFSTNAGIKGDVPYRSHNTSDVGFIKLPTKNFQNEMFASNDDRPPAVIQVDQGVSPGTRVAWAGFPGDVENVLGFPQMCYFEGVISAMVDRPGKRLYVVDGHNSFGVSGGPVWHWSDKQMRAELVGVVSAYKIDPAGLPGFCVFEPINEIVKYLYYWNSQLKDDSIEMT